MSPTPYDVPFNRATPAGKEIEYVLEAINQGHISGDGPFSKRCEALLQETLGVPRALLTTSCTDALDMSAVLLDIEPGDEVICPTFTFVSTINAYVLRGARPVFIDSRPDTLNIDETQLERLITPRTKAILPVHYAGIACEMDAICEIAAAHNDGIAIVEDNAHGLFARYNGKLLGTFGAMATQSFHETKNFTSGEGGALLINDERYVERAEIIREKGTDRSKFIRGQVDKYTWVDIGSSHLPSDMLAAFLYAQLEEREAIQAKRAHVWQTYAERLAPWAEKHGVRLPIVPDNCEQSYHLFYLLLKSEDERNEFITYMRENGILSVFHYLPLHLSPMGQLFGGKECDCPVAESASERLVRLPLYADLSDELLERVIDAVEGFEC